MAFRLFMTDSSAALPPSGVLPAIGTKPRIGWWLVKIDITPGLAASVPTVLNCFW